MYFVMKKDNFHFCVSLDDTLNVISFLQESGILKQYPIEKEKNAREEAVESLSSEKIERELLGNKLPSFLLHPPQLNAAKRGLSLTRCPQAL